MGAYAKDLRFTQETQKKRAMADVLGRDKKLIAKKDKLEKNPKTMRRVN